jgi:hypothetical protein
VSGHVIDWVVVSRGVGGMPGCRFSLRALYKPTGGLRSHPGWGRGPVMVPGLRCRTGAVSDRGPPLLNCGFVPCWVEAGAARNEDRIWEALRALGLPSCPWEPGPGPGRFGPRVSADWRGSVQG